MNKSDQTNEIFKAISEAQGEFKTVEKSSTNPHFKSKFAPLDNIIEMLRPILPKHGLSFVQFTDIAESGIVVETIITHASGQWISGCLQMPTVKQDPQGYGSALTYGRRYGLAAAFGVASDEDVDGNQNNNTPTTPPTTTKPKESDQGKQMPQQQGQPHVKLTPSQEAYDKMIEWIDRAAVDRKRVPDKEVFKAWFRNDENKALVEVKSMLDAQQTSAVNRHFEQTLAIFDQLKAS